MSTKYRLRNKTRESSSSSATATTSRRTQPTTSSKTPTRKHTPPLPPSIPEEDDNDDMDMDMDELVIAVENEIEDDSEVDAKEEDGGYNAEEESENEMKHKKQNKSSNSNNTYNSNKKKSLKNKNENKNDNKEKSTTVTKNTSHTNDKKHKKKLSPSSVFMNQMKRLDEKEAEESSVSIKSTRSPSDEEDDDDDDYETEDESSDSNSEDDDSSTDEDDDDDDDDDETYETESTSSSSSSSKDSHNKHSKKSKKRKDIIILYNEDSMFGGGGCGNDEEMIHGLLNDEDEECHSDDEKAFMKENYEKVSFQSSPSISPSSVNEGKKDKKTSTTKKNLNNDNDNTKTKTKNKNNKKKTGNKENETDEDDSSSETPDMSPEEIETEYRELVDLKKHLVEKLKRKNKSKVLINAVEECKKDIHKLVLNTRRKNAKEYYRLISADRKTQTSELEYFKKKLSHKEQVQVMKDLKEVNSFIYNEKPYRLTLMQSSIPSKYKANVMQKMNMMLTMEQGDSEYHKIKMWIDTFMRIPFDVYNDLSISIHDGLDVCDKFMRNARKTLDECTYGLDNAKMQIMQLVGQWITNPRSIGTSIAIYGPKGTGKTSLAKEGISKIFGREFSFISLGGAGDASFLEGHSYTYEGSIYGKIVQILIESKCMNPIIYFDELDKVSDSARGQEIISLLTHLTDSTQNSQFHDKYFADIDFDLSRCLFIFSYNDEALVNPILKDRMYHIQTKAYDVKEKVIIAKKYLLPKIREQVNFQESDILIPDDVIQHIISTEKYTQKEEGVRNLKRCLEIIYTKLNLFRLMKSDNENIEYILGKGVNLKVEFPYSVSIQDLDVLIKIENNQIQSWLNMYI